MPQDNAKENYVSIVIPTYNSAMHLPRCLDAVNKQRYPYKQILVIDNYSSDETQNIAKTFGANVIFFKGTQAAARNIGLAHSKGDYVFFVDSDQQLSNDVIQNCVLLCSKQAVNAVKIPEVFVGLNFWGACSALWKNNLVKAWGTKGGIPRFYSRQILLKQSAFNRKLRWWEDLELYERLKATGLKEAWCREHVIHYESYTLKSAARKYLVYGKSVTSFKSSNTKAPYTTTFRLTLATITQILREPGKSARVFLGCIFLSTVKSLSAAIGLLSQLSFVHRLLLATPSKKEKC